MRMGWDTKRMTDNDEIDRLSWGFITVNYIYIYLYIQAKKKRARVKR